MSNSGDVLRIWKTKHCHECNRQTQHTFTKVERVVNGYPEIRYFEYNCLKCGGLTETVHLKVEQNKHSADYGCNEAQLEFMDQCRYNGENLRNWITLVDQLRAEREKNR